MVANKCDIMIIIPESIAICYVYAFRGLILAWVSKLCFTRWMHPSCTFDPEHQHNLAVLHLNMSILMLKCPNYIHYIWVLWKRYYCVNVNIKSRVVYNRETLWGRRGELHSNCLLKCRSKKWFSLFIFPFCLPSWTLHYSPHHWYSMKSLHVLHSVKDYLHL